MNKPQTLPLSRINPFFETPDTRQKKFFCLRGYMKSGTNWVCNLLNLHPEISCVGEFHWQNVIASLHFNFDFIHLFTRKPHLRDRISRHFERAIAQCLMETADPQVRLVGDRTPATIEPIVFRGAPHICVIRDGRDVLISRIFHLFNRIQNPRIKKLFDKNPSMYVLYEKLEKNPHYFEKHPFELLSCEPVVRESARTWAQFIRQDQRTIKSMPELPVLTIRYEDLHRDVEKQRERMYRFLKVDPEWARPLSKATEPGFKTSSPREFYRSGRIGDWQQHMTDQARQWFNEEAGDELIALNYACDRNW